MEFGAKVHTCSRSDTELNRSLSEWRSQGYAVTGSTCDVSVRDQRERLIDTVSSVFSGKLNILVRSSTLLLRSFNQHADIDVCLSIRCKLLLLSFWSILLFN